MSEGPCAPPLSPDSAAWQMLHCWRNSDLPAAESAPNAGTLAKPTPAQTPDNTLSIVRLIPVCLGATSLVVSVQFIPPGVFISLLAIAGRTGSERACKTPAIVTSS